MPDIPPFPDNRADLITELTARGEKMLPGILDMELLDIGDGSASMRCSISTKHLALNGYLHAGSIVAFADTAAGYGCLGNLPEGSIGFTTIELKTNHVSTLLDGVMVARASMTHGGRSTQVWDVTVSDQKQGKPLAHYRCTQMILYPQE